MKWEKIGRPGKNRKRANINDKSYKKLTTHHNKINHIILRIYLVHQQGI